MSLARSRRRVGLGPNKLKKAHMMSRLFLVLMRATRLQVFEPFFNRHKTLIAGTLGWESWDTSRKFNPSVSVVAQQLEVGTDYLYQKRSFHKPPRCICPGIVDDKATPWNGCLSSGLTPSARIPRMIDGISMLSATSATRASSKPLAGGKQCCF